MPQEQKQIRVNPLVRLIFRIIQTKPVLVPKDRHPESNDMHRVYMYDSYLIGKCDDIEYNVSGFCVSTRLQREKEPNKIAFGRVCIPG